MKLYLPFCVILFININIYSQVGIGNTDPKAQLDIRSSNQANPSNTDGILIPKADDFPTANPTIDQDGMLMFLTGSGTPAKGFYYWDFTQTFWIPLETNGVKEINDLLDGKSDPNGSSVFLGQNAGAADNGTNNANTAVGLNTMTATTTGEQNVAFGNTALSSNTLGNYNTALGKGSMASNLTGSYNVASGRNALNSNTTGSYNSALGHNALLSNTVGQMNSGFGDAALYLNQGGSFNAAFGKSALYGNVSGTNNTAIGYESGRNATGSSNIFIGNQSGRDETGSNKLYIENSNANANNALIYGEFDTNLLRVNGHLTLPIVADASGAVGSGVLEIGSALRFDNNEIITNTNAALYLQHDNNGDLHIDNTTFMVDASDNLVGIGITTPFARLDVRSSSQTVPSNTDGVLIPKANNFPTVNPGVYQDGMLLFLTGFGTPTKGFYYWNNPTTSWVGVGSVKAINDLTDGKTLPTSVFLGENAGLNDSGSRRNTGVGYNALSANTTGSSNTALGNLSLQNNTTGYQNTVVGKSAMGTNTSGFSNTAVGHLALLENTVGNNNSAIGVNALRNNISATNNTAVGMDALYTNAAGNDNVAVGYQAAYYNQTYGNTAIGSNAMYLNGTGTNNVAVGHQALNDLTTGSNNIGIGYDSQVPVRSLNNQVRIGNTDITYAGVQVAWTVTSDKRWKDHIRPLPYGLNMISQLMPVDYIRKNNDHQTREIGFIAQDVKKLLQQLGYDDQGILTEDDKGYMSLRYNDFIPVLVKAVQEQQDLITAQQQELIDLKTQLTEYQTLEQRIQALEQAAPNN